MTEQTTHGSGGAMHFDDGKLRLDAVPPDLIQAAAAAIEYGSAKYEDGNWAKGMAFSKVYGSLQRHLNEFWSGNDTDPESGLHHLSHAAANLSFLLTYINRGIGTDNRVQLGVAPAELGDNVIRM